MVEKQQVPLKVALIRFAAARGMNLYDRDVLRRLVEEYCGSGKVGGPRFDIEEFAIKPSWDSRSAELKEKWRQSGSVRDTPVLYEPDTSMIEEIKAADTAAPPTNMDPPAKRQRVESSASAKLSQVLDKASLPSIDAAESYSSPTTFTESLSCSQHVKDLVVPMVKSGGEYFKWHRSDGKLGAWITQVIKALGLTEGPHGVGPGSIPLAPHQLRPHETSLGPSSAVTSSWMCTWHPEGPRCLVLGIPKHTILVILNRTGWSELPSEAPLEILGIGVAENPLPDSTEAHSGTLVDAICVADKFQGTVTHRLLLLDLLALNVSFPWYFCLMLLHLSVPRASRERP